MQAKCIICSSDQVYFGNFKEGAHSEEEEVNPLNLYGREKRTAETECLKVNADCVLLRLSWMYDNRTLHEGEHSDFLRGLLSKLKGQENVCCAVHDTRGLTDVKEVVRNMELVFNIPGGIYNFGAPNDTDHYHTINEVFCRVGLNTERLQKNEETFRDNPRNLSMSQEKINRWGVFFASTVEGLVQNLNTQLRGD